MKVVIYVVGTVVFLIILLSVLSALPFTGANGDCERHIKEGLKDPVSAWLNLKEGYTWKSTGKPSKIVFRVRATNSFGAFLTQEMACHYNEKGEFLEVTVE